MQSYLDMMQGPVRVVFTVPELSFDPDVPVSHRVR